MKQSAGILLYRKKNNTPEFLLVHPGGPFWKNKDLGAWSIPKGEFDENDEPIETALREFEEETGFKFHGDFLELTPIRQKSGKKVFAFAQEADLDVSAITSNEFELEWPPKSGKIIMVPEIDKAEWFTEKTALEKINEAQRSFISELMELIGNQL